MRDAHQCVPYTQFKRLDNKIHNCHHRLECKRQLKTNKLQENNTTDTSKTRQQKCKVTHRKHPKKILVKNGMHDYQIF